MVQPDPLVLLDLPEVLRDRLVRPVLLVRLVLLGGLLDQPAQPEIMVLPVPLDRLVVQVLMARPVQPEFLVRLDPLEVPLVQPAIPVRQDQQVRRALLVLLGQLVRLERLEPMGRQDQQARQVMQVRLGQRVQPVRQALLPDRLVRLDQMALTVQLDRLVLHLLWGDLRGQRDLPETLAQLVLLDLQDPRGRLAAVGLQLLLKMKVRRLQLALLHLILLVLA